MSADITAAQIKGARAMLGWSLDDLSADARVHRNTAQKAETGEASAPTLAAIRQAFERAGIVFIDRNGGGEGVRLRSGSNPVTIISRKRKP